MSAEVILGVVGAVAGLGGAGAAVVALRQNSKLATQSDGIQERLVAVEEARRQDELRPVLTLEDEFDSGRSRLTIRNDGIADVDHLEITELVTVPEVIAKDIRSIIGQLHPLRMGAAQLLPVHRDEEMAGGLLVLRLRVRCGNDEWNVTTRCEIEDSFGPQVY